MGSVNSFRRKLMIALAIPIVALVALATAKGVAQHSGNTILIPIEGYDPRDLLSGHYLTYRLSFAASIHCGDDERSEVIYVCLVQTDNDDVTAETVSSPNSEYDHCDVTLKGTCEVGRFTAGLERFYIPESYSAALDRAVRNRRGKLLVSVGSDGDAAIKDLLIDDIPWKQFLEKTLE